MSSTTPTTKRRPRWFRALGHQEPPREITVGGLSFRHSRTFKHDSWAATAVYHREDRKIVCKFNRKQSVFGIPAGWIGRLLARRENRMLKELADIETVPDWSGDVEVDGKLWRNVAAHEFVTGHPLGCYSEIDGSIWRSLRATVSELHQRNMAYVDLHKLENVIVDEAGRPHLIDFQISVKLANIWPLSSLLHILQQSDIYHLDKHQAKRDPESTGTFQRPWWIRFHRSFAVPFRTARRRLLTWIGVRSRQGTATSEQFVEEGLGSRNSLGPVAHKQAA